jgi:ribosomal protein S18 acetylase RimI-like enzyme
MSIAIRPVRHGDIATLASIHAQCFPDEAWDASALATVLALPGTSGRVAASETAELSGFLITQCLGEVAEILTLGVAPVTRRRGIARALLLDCCRQSEVIGAERIVLEVAADNAAGLALYQSLGFIRQGTRQGYYRRSAGPPVDAWRLSLTLPPRIVP